MTVLSLDPGNVNGSRAEAGDIGVSGSGQTHRVLDCLGLYCPMPIMKTREEIDIMAIGEILEVLSDDKAAESDLKAWSKRSGQTILNIQKTDEGLRFFIKKTK